jgi:hypothetical protein
MDIKGKQMGEQKSGVIVPHHRVEKALHAKAKAKTLVDGVSLSTVAEIGLKSYTANAKTNIKNSAKDKVSAGKLTRESPRLPDATRAVLVKMNATNDERLNTFLYQLHLAGWSYATLAEPLGVSRQAVHLRLAAWDNIESESPLPNIPVGYSQNSFPSHALAENVERFDWAIWINRDLYALASECAKVAHDSLRVVMENILRDYVSGNLVADKKTDVEKNK